MRPRCPRPNDGGGPKRFEPEVLASGGFVLGVKPLRPPARVVLRCLEIEIFDVLAHLAAKAAGLVVRGAPDDEKFDAKVPSGV
jgi:hypothetical protein